MALTVSHPMDETGIKKSKNMEISVEVWLATYGPKLVQELCVKLGEYPYNKDTWMQDLQEFLKDKNIPSTNRTINLKTPGVSTPCHGLRFYN